MKVENKKRATRKMAKELLGPLFFPLFQLLVAEMQTEA